MAASPSSQKWLAVATTTNEVVTRWATPSQPHRHGLTRHIHHATSAAHPTCTDGNAESWSATSRVVGPYTDWPYCAAVSTKPAPGSSRGGATVTRCTTKQPAVSSTTLIRTDGYELRW